MKDNSSNKLLKEVNLVTSSTHWDKMDTFLEYLIDAQYRSILSMSSIEDIKEATGRIKAYELIRSLPKTIEALRKAPISN